MNATINKVTLNTAALDAALNSTHTQTANELKAILTTLQGSLQNAYTACGTLARACLAAPATVPTSWLSEEVVQKLRATGFKVIRDKKAQTASILVALNPDKTLQWQEIGGVMTLATYSKPVEPKGYRGVTKGDISARIIAKLSLTREQLEFIQKNLDKLF